MGVHTRSGGGGCNILALPEELKMKILGYLSYSDLKSVVLVCRQWRRMGEQPFLWRHFTLLVRTEVSRGPFLVIATSYDELFNARI